MDDQQIDVISNVALRVISIPKTFIGKLSIEMNVQYGTICDLHITQGETIRVNRKKRRVVSRGIKNGF